MATPHPMISRNLAIHFDGSALGCTSDFSWNITKEYIEVLCMNSTAKKKVPDIYDWTLSFNGTVNTDATETGIGYFDLVDSMINTDLEVSVYILPDVSTQRYLVGNGYLSTVSNDGGKGAAVTFSAEITGSGPLSIVTTV